MANPPWLRQGDCGWGAGPHHVEGEWCKTEQGALARSLRKNQFGAVEAVGGDDAMVLARGVIGRTTALTFRRKVPAVPISGQRSGGRGFGGPGGQMGWLGRLDAPAEGGVCWLLRVWVTGGGSFRADWRLRRAVFRGKHGFGLPLWNLRQRESNYCQYEFNSCKHYFASSSSYFVSWSAGLASWLHGFNLCLL